MRIKVNAESHNSSNQNVDYTRSSHFSWRINIKFYFSYIAQQPLVGLGIIIVAALRSHSDTPHPVGILWTNYQSDTETSTLQHWTLTRDRQPCPRWNPHYQQTSSRRPIH